MDRLRAKLHDPVFWTDASQLLKTVAGAVIAWVLARQVFGIVQPFLAPWAALLTVNATVYRTLARGAQQVGATVLGVLLAFAAGNLFGVNAVTLGAMLLVAMLVGSARGLRAESTTAAATGLVVLLTGYSGDGGILAARLLDTVIGIGVGLVVNLLVWPPLRDRSAARQVDRIDDRIGDLLSAMAGRLGDGAGEADAPEWVDRTRELDHDIDAAWATVRQARESGRLNVRRHARARRRPTGSRGCCRGSSRRSPRRAAWHGPSGARAPRRATGSPTSARRGSTSWPVPGGRSAMPTRPPSGRCARTSRRSARSSSTRAGAARRGLCTER